MNVATTTEVLTPGAHLVTGIDGDHLQMVARCRGCQQCYALECATSAYRGWAHEEQGMDPAVVSEAALRLLVMGYCVHCHRPAELAGGIEASRGATV